MNNINLNTINFDEYLRSTTAGMPKMLFVVGFIASAYNVEINCVRLQGITHYTVKGLEGKWPLSLDAAKFLAPVRQAYPAKAPKPQPRLQEAARVVAQAVVKTSAPVVIPQPAAEPTIADIHAELREENKQLVNKTGKVASKRKNKKVEEVLP